MSRFAYADPPYVGQAKRHYRNHPDYKGEVDHKRLVATLETYDGWALSLSMKSLQLIIQLCPEDVIVLAWFKTLAPPLRDHRRYTWEPVILKPLRRYGPGYVPTALIDAPTLRPQHSPMGSAHVIGEKPEAFCHWVFAAGGLDKDDELVDLFPGSGAVGHAWESYIPGPTVSDGYRATKAN